MNNKTQEALKMAIAEIEGWIDHAYGHTPEKCADNKAIKACKEALAQPAQDFFERGKEIAKWADKRNEQPARLVSYAPDKSTCTLNIDGEEVYFNREQPAQEPVAWISVKDKLPDVGVEVLTYDTHHEKKYFLNSIIIDKVDKFYFNGFTHWMPLPSAPNEINTHPAPSWQTNKEFVLLSDDEKLAIIRKWKDAHTMREQELIGLGDAIEQALKEKNT